MALQNPMFQLLTVDGAARISGASRAMIEGAILRGELSVFAEVVGADTTGSRPLMLDDDVRGWARWWVARHPTTRLQRRLRMERALAQTNEGAQAPDEPAGPLQPLEDLTREKEVPED